MTKSQFAAGTTVPIERSRVELERTLERYGATAFGIVRDPSRTMIEFIIEGYRTRFVLDAVEPTGRTAKAEQAAAQRERQAWRVLILLVKAKLEAIATGHADYRTEFFAQLVLPTGETVNERFGDDLSALPPAGSLLALGRGA